VTGWQRLDQRTIVVAALYMLGVAFLAGVPTAVGLTGPFGVGVALAWVLPGAALVVALGVVVDWLNWRSTRGGILHFAD